jgi:membrane protease YdiL (CAAX protease family)
MIEAQRSIATRAIALAIVAFDVADIRLQTGYSGSLLTLAALIALLCLNDGTLPALGMTRVPIQGWRYWCRAALWIGLAVGVVVALAAGAWVLLGGTLPLTGTPPSFSALFFMCVYAPVYEEVVYRSLLTVAVAPSLGPRGTIACSGAVFALIHLLRGNASPENQIAGFFLEWAFLKSGTILVPMAMHSAGNLIALSMQVAGWYWLAAR